MFELRPFVPKDLREFADNAAEVSIQPYLKELDFDALGSAGPGWSGYWNDIPVAAGGFVEVYQDNPMRATAWTIMLGQMPRGAFLHVHRAVKKAILDAPYKRIEAHVDCDFWASRHWMELLGFKVETERKDFWTPDGRAITEYVCIKDAD